jgi:hypothetical protein
MRLLRLFAAMVFVPALAHAQTDTSAQTVPSFTVTAGAGSAMGWAGMQAEAYLHSGRVSVFGGAGYASGADEGYVGYAGPAFAGGVRWYTRGPRHRLFAEFLESVIAVYAKCISDCRAFYGPGGQAGYQFVARRGFTATGSAGYGYSPSGSIGGWLGSFGAGFTWRRG